MSIEIGGKALETDEQRYLESISEWEPTVAETIAKLDAIELTDEHWTIINILRDYYDEYQVAPAVQVLNRNIGKKLGRDKGNSKFVYDLFPEGPAVQACQYAGLPKPTGCV
ncbi:MAG: TusE/DsrC/DsvC family sulfur relay protein [Gammaproteobacteria bacterium]|nr:TusE/DsrC/DsvC family sulfur relay protein [Gammaproteobacteria bacterium]